MIKNLFKNKFIYFLLFILFRGLLMKFFSFRIFLFLGYQTLPMNPYLLNYLILLIFLLLNIHLHILSSKILSIHLVGLVRHYFYLHYQIILECLVLRNCLTKILMFLAYLLFYFHLHLLEKIILKLFRVRNLEANWFYYKVIT